VQELQQEFGKDRVVVSVPQWGDCRGTQVLTAEHTGASSASFDVGVTAPLPVLPQGCMPLNA
jgi:hypothetical protein